jgi:hypothetical protein
MARVYNANALIWKGDRLKARIGKVAVEVVPDSKYLKMFRVRSPDGSLGDMVNHTRARDAAKSILLALLNHKETSPQAPPMRKSASPYVG